MKREKIYNYDELPHLKIPTQIRQYINTMCRENNINNRVEVTVRFRNSNYRRPTKVIDLDLIKQLEDLPTTKMFSKKDTLLHNAKCYLNDNKKDVITEFKSSNYGEQSLALGKSRCWLSSHRTQNTKIYRYMRFIGKDDFVLAKELIATFMSDLAYELDELADEFGSVKKLAHHIMHLGLKSNNVEYVKESLDRIMVTTEPNYNLLKKAKFIKKLLEKDNEFIT